jgi:hypothetical protein
MQPDNHSAVRLRLIALRRWLSPGLPNILCDYAFHAAVLLYNKKAALLFCNNAA